MDVKDAFRQVAVEWERSPTFGHVFRDLVVVDRRFQFGWRNSPGLWSLFASAPEYSHVNTSHENAVITESGRKATAHVEVTQPPATDRPNPLPRCCRVPPNPGGGIAAIFFVRYYVVDGLMVKVQRYPSGIRCLMASASLASDHLRLFGERSARDPPLLSARKVPSWDTRLGVLGWERDTIAMTISLPSSKLVKLCHLLREWPADRLLASVKEVRSLLGKLLRVCEVARAGKFSYVACSTRWAFLRLRYGRESSSRHGFRDAGGFNLRPSSMPMLNFGG